MYTCYSKLCMSEFGVPKYHSWRNSGRAFACNNGKKLVDPLATYSMMKY